MADYFAAERASPVPHEFRRRRIVARAAATEAHTLVRGNIAGHLWVALKRSPYRVYGPSLRVRSGFVGDYVYPDVTVVRGPADIERMGVDLESITNPCLTVEVLSPSTEADDRGEKFDGYRQILRSSSTFSVAQDQPYVLTFTRQAGGG